MRQLLLIVYIYSITTVAFSRQIVGEEYNGSSQEVSSTEQQYVVDHFESTRFSRKNRTRLLPVKSDRNKDIPFIVFGEDINDKQFRTINNDNNDSFRLVNNQSSYNPNSKVLNNEKNSYNKSSKNFRTTSRPRHSTIVRTISTTESSDVFAKQKTKRKKPQDAEIWLDKDNSLNDDEADPDFLPSSAGNGKEKSESSANDGKDDDSKKTLSDQVKEGKYGLIQNELFQEKPKRPGILSYATNSETSNDNKDTLGGLSQDDIWLAENSLLVLRGGDLNTKAHDEPWVPIDGYKSSKRPVKIPSNPKVPPPFPVQLEEDGPIQFLGNNPFPVFNPFTNESINLLSPKGYPQAEPYFQNFPFPLPPPENLTNTFIPPPLLHSLVNPNQTFVNPFLHFPPPPFGPPGPPFDPNNTTEFDEDDPSLYYPPPYSFVYDSNYTNPVAPGPLVPGIVLPPPPNYFSRLNDSKSKQPGKTTQDVITRLQNINGRTKLYATTTKPTISPERYRTTTGRTVLKITKPVSVEISKAKVKGPFEPIKEFERHNFVIPTSTTVQQSTTTTLKPTTVYYNYFEAKEPSTTTTKRPKTLSRPMSYKEIVRKPPNYESTSAKPPVNTYLPVANFDYDKYVYITPKPEIHVNGRPSTENYDYIPISNIQLLPSKQSQLKSFEEEIETIKQTLRYYKTTTGAPLRSGNDGISTSRPVYEYSFDSQNTNKDYGFRPMVPNYQGYQYDASTEAPVYYHSTTLHPTHINNNNFRPKKQKASRGKPITQMHFDSTQDSTTEYPVYPSTRVPYYVPKYNNQGTTPQNPSAAIVSIEKQILRELIPQTGAIPQSNFNHNPRLNPYLQNSPSSGPHEYYQIRQKPLERIVIGNQTYIVYRIKSPRPSNIFNQRPIRPPVTNSHIRQPQQHSQQQQQHEQPITLDSDINVNYRHPLPVINPESEYVPNYNTGSNGRYRDPHLIQYRLPGDQAQVYFIPPFEKK